MSNDEVEEQVDKWVREVIELRFGKAEDPDGDVLGFPGDHPDEVVHMLNRVRIRSDRIEEIQSNLRRVRGRIKRSLDAAQLEADLKRDESFVRNRASRTMDFVTADERKADAALDSLEEKRAALALKRLHDFVQEAHDVVDQARWGLSAYRQDLRAQLHALQVVRSMEYSSAGTDVRGIS